MSQRNATRAHLALDVTGDGVLDWDLATGAFWFSPSWASMLGYAENEIGDSFGEWDERLHPDDRERVHRQLAIHLAGDSPLFREECRLRCKDGSHKWVAMRIKAVEFAADGRPLRLVGIQTDVSVGKHADQLADENAERYRVLWEQLPLPMLTHVAGVIRHMNQECVTLLGGKAADEFYGASILQVIHPDYQAIAMDRLQRPVQGAQNAESIELKLIRRDGSETWVETTCLAIPWAGQQAICLVGKEINDRKRAEAQEENHLREFESIYLLSKAVTAADSLDQVLEAAMDAFLTVLKADRVSIRLLDFDARVHFESCRGLSDDYCRATAGNSPWLSDEFDPQPVFVEDIESDDRLAWFRPAAKAEGISAIGFVPLLRQGRTVGKFTVHFDAPRRFFTADIRLAKTIAAHVSFAVERQLAEETLHQSKELLQMTLRCAPDAAFICSQDGRISYANDMFVSMLGRSREELYEATIFDLFPPDRRERYRQEFRLAFSSSDRHVEEIRLLRKDGKKIPLELNAALLPNGQVYGACRDIAERKRMERELRIAATAFETQEGILVTDADNLILNVNQAFTTVTGYSAEEVLGKTPAILNSGRHDAQFYQVMWERLTHDKFWEGEIWNRRKDGSVYPERLAITAVTDNANTVINYVATFSDITRQKRSEEEIHNLAFFDPLTSLPNRRLLFDRIQQSMAASARHGQHGAVIFIDLDHFKTLNDTKGHEMGDLMLIEVGQRLQHCVRDFDTVSRLGGDEFVVLLGALRRDGNEAASQAAKVAQTIRTTLSQPYLLQGHEFHYTPSIGVAMFRGREESIDNLIRHADIAMYQAKSAGRNAVRFFDVAMQAALETRMDLEQALRQALSQQQFELHFQIQVHNAHGIIGVEALLRWAHPERGMMLPAAFIPLAEETGLILPIGEWVLRTACAQIKAWSENQATRQLHVAVNVSPVQFAQAGFVSQVQQVLAESGIDPACLKLELTESLLLDNVDSVIGKMHQLKALGVSLSMDDFGTGFSSLSYLKRLPLDQLKIDQSFVRDLVSDDNDKNIVQAIITMGDAFGLNIIAEGVETVEQRTQLAYNGCHSFQGYLFGKPMPIEQIDAVLARQQRSRADRCMFAN
ncbi:MAG: EAL domain-containing protein [Sulfuritalea sp.]|nr:EAL domain-containing protein [Sulfuritalea sp.]